MRLYCLAFSDRGMALARTLAEALGGTAQRCGQDLPLKQWTQDHFLEGNGLVFVGAAGIAVRAIAPWVKSKATDPAVVAVDERGQFAVALLSGHLGGANDLARRIAAVLGATPVITTATDAGGIFAVDEWARCQGFTVADPAGIKPVSAALLAGRTVRVRSAFPIAGEPPAGVLLTEGAGDVTVDIRPGPGLNLIPRVLVLGVGCRRGTTRAALEAALDGLLDQTGIDPRAVFRAATIDLKAGEPGLLEFCQAHGWPLETYSAEDLARVPGHFSASDFVSRTVGVDNVCERSAVLASGGTLFWEKTAGGGVTMALAMAPCLPDWRWKNG
ncbi:MAG: cobalt-precorrin 5A hydrolase [Eubacteriales bacterium]|nr:cobalt-precorrin 5A hydrolase [Eubacteriales bacterium]